MKTPPQFWPLLKHELSLKPVGRTGQAVVFLFLSWASVVALPYVLLFGDASSRANVATVFDAGFLPVAAMMFVIYLTMWVAFATIPALCELLSADGGIPGIAQGQQLEFLLTRAVDRRILYRARTVALLLFVLAPFVLNVAVSPLAPEVRFASNDTTSAEAAARQEKYTRAFHSDRAETSRGQMTLPGGAVAYCAWIAWGAAAALLLLQGYANLIANFVKPNRWWTGLFPVAPMLFVLLWMIFRGRLLPESQGRLFEESFLLFSTHPLPMWLALLALGLAIEFWCERRFARFEIQ